MKIGPFFYALIFLLVLQIFHFQLDLYSGSLFHIHEPMLVHLILKLRTSIKLALQFCPQFVERTGFL